MGAPKPPSDQYYPTSQVQPTKQAKLSLTTDTPLTLQVQGLSGQACNPHQDGILAVGAVDGPDSLVGGGDGLVHHHFSFGLRDVCKAPSSVTREGLIVVLMTKDGGG